MFRDGTRVKHGILLADLTGWIAGPSFPKGSSCMGNRRSEAVTAVVKRRLASHTDGQRKISQVTADKIFVGMMRDQARFGVGRRLLDSRMAVILSDLRGVLSPRIRRF